MNDFSRTTGDMIVAWVKDPTDGLYLIGPVGTGKTHMAAAIVRFLIEAGQRAKFARAADFYSALRATYSEEGSEKAVLDDYLRPQFLILDDVGAGSMSDHERRFTLELLDKRLNERRPTIVTSNWKIDEIGDRMDVRIASRLSGFTTLGFGGKDRRVKSA